MEEEIIYKFEEFQENYEIQNSSEVYKEDCE